MKGIILLTLFGFALAAPSGRNGKPCLCELLVDEVRTLVTAQDSQEEIIGYVSEICSNLEGEDKNTCRMMIGSYSSIMIETVTSQLTPQQVCKLLPDVCPGAEEEAAPPAVLEVPPVEEVTEPKGLLECELCKLIIEGVDRLIKTNRSEEAINATLEKFCHGLPAKIAPMCEEIEPKVIDALKNGLPPDAACSLAGLCTSEETFHLPCDTCLTAMDAIGLKDPNSVCVERGSCNEEPTVEEAEPETNAVSEPIKETEPAETHEETNIEDTLECQLCKFLVQAADKLVGENKTAYTINATLYDFCENLPGELKDVCLQSEPEILKAVLGGIDPTIACDFVKACRDTSSVPLSSLYIPCEACKEAMEGIAGERGLDICYEINGICEEDQKNPIINKSSVFPPVVDLGDDAQCELCKFVIELLDQLVANNASIAQINATLFEICKSLPAQLQGQCAMLVPNIEKIIQHGFDPENACIAINFCQEEMESFDFPLLTCDACNTVVERVLPAKVIEQKSGALCHLSCHGRSRRSISDNMERWQSMASTIQQVITDEDHMDASFLGCELCKIVIRLVDEIAGQNATVQTVNQTIDEICTRLAGQQLVDICLQEAPKIVTFMDDGIKPDTVCKAAGMCDAEATAAADDAEPSLYDMLYARGIKEVGKLDNVKDLKCDICEELIKLVDSYLENNATDAQINQTLERFCSGLPAGSFQNLCMSVIPDIMKTVDGGLDPDQACTIAKLCSQETITVEVEQEQKEMPKIQDEPNDLKCDLCKELVELVDKQLEDNTTDEKINQTLNRICNGLPSGALQDICTGEIPAIMKTVEGGGLDPNMSCIAAKLCLEGMGRKKKTDILSKYLEPEKKKLVDLKPLKCEICEAVVDEVDAVLGENRTEAKVNETVYNLCKRLVGGALQDVCLQMAPQVVTLIDDGVNYEKVCGAIGLCSSQEQEKHEVLEEVEELSKPLLCDACVRTMNVVYTNMENDYPKIEPAMAELCQHLPEQYQHMCGVFVANDKGLYFKKFLEQVNPEVLCDAVECQ